MAQRADILREYKESGEGVKQFCEKRGINRHQYFYWQRRLRQVVCDQLESEQCEQSPSLSVSGFTRVRLEAPPSQKTLPPVSESACGLHIEVGGVQISADAIYPPDKLAELLRGLGQC